mmetsp:Transcript_90677/g.170981  ORF Transcript_90677/g.170981 Transcript_90677/m.170981 type:complete len:213 (-) Transcript_90677:119-757(-)
MPRGAIIPRLPTVVRARNGPKSGTKLPLKLKTASGAVHMDMTQKQRPRPLTILKYNSMPGPPMWPISSRLVSQTHRHLPSWSTGLDCCRCCLAASKFGAGFATSESVNCPLLLFRIICHASLAGCFDASDWLPVPCREAAAGGLPLWLLCRLGVGRGESNSSTASSQVSGSSVVAAFSVSKSVSRLHRHRGAAKSAKSNSPQEMQKTHTRKK